MEMNYFSIQRLILKKKLLRSNNHGSQLFWTIGWDSSDIFFRLSPFPLTVRDVEPKPGWRMQKKPKLGWRKKREKEIKKSRELERVNESGTLDVCHLPKIVIIIARVCFFTKTATKRKMNVIRLRVLHAHSASFYFLCPGAFCTSQTLLNWPSITVLSHWSLEEEYKKQKKRRSRKKEQIK